MPITRCPECATLFRCHSQQLEQAQGWVRCGRCSAVFEALRHVCSSPAAAAQGLPASPVDDPRKVEPSLDGWADLATRLEPERRAAADGALDAGPRWPGWVLAMVILLLLLLLPGQWLVDQRERLAAQSSMWRGVWTEGCRWWGCEIGWPRQPQSLRIESVLVEPASSGLYDVQLHIRNGATHPLATPWVELSLLGLRDEVLVRRAVSPQELGLDSPVLALRDVAARLRFQLPDDLAPDVAGYKAILFYP